MAEKKPQRYNKRIIQIPGEMKFECFVIQQSTREKTILKPTDETWEYFHLIKMKTHKTGTVDFQELAGIISRPELSDDFNFSHLKSNI